MSTAPSSTPDSNKDDDNSDHPSASTVTFTQKTANTNNSYKSLPPMGLAMPGLSLAELSLHSPSSQIVGTPFATNSTPFEYPFPATPPASASSNVSSSTSPSLPTSSPPSLSHFPPPEEIKSTYTLSHPKMRTSSNPPIPPGLVKKRHRWSLGLLGRRRSSYGSDEGDGKDKKEKKEKEMMGIIKDAPEGSGNV